MATRKKRRTSKTFRGHTVLCEIDLECAVTKSQLRARTQQLAAANQNRNDEKDAAVRLREAAEKLRRK